MSRKDTSATSSRSSRGLKVGIAAVVVVLVGGAGAADVLAAGKGNPVKTHPAPTLFTTAQTSPLAKDLAAQKPLADKAFQVWASTHPRQDDAAFTAFALAAVPAPPGQDVTTTELAELHQLAAGRTPAGLSAATWLEVYGKKDVWKLYLSDAVETSGAADRAVAKARFASDTALAKSLTAAAQLRFGRQAPTVVDPSLRKGAARKAKLSYPSKHAVYVFSELALLTALDPGRAGDFQRMTDQVAYSRLYAAGHYRSDLVAGAFLGDLLGDYEARGLTG